MGALCVSVCMCAHVHVCKCVCQDVGVGWGWIFIRATIIQSERLRNTHICRMSQTGDGEKRGERKKKDVKDEGGKKEKESGEDHGSVTQDGIHVHILHTSINLSMSLSLVLSFSLSISLSHHPMNQCLPSSLILKQPVFYPTSLHQGRLQGHPHHRSSQRDWLPRIAACLLKRQ